MNEDVVNALDSLGNTKERLTVTTFCGQANKVVVCGWTKGRGMFIVGVSENGRTQFITIFPESISRVEQRENTINFFSGHINPMYSFSYESAS